MTPAASKCAGWLPTVSVSGLSKLPERLCCITKRVGAFIEAKFNLGTAKAATAGQGRV
jgi:hypothetical protein